ncbi:4009_t:CDS:2, partial [Dentiscutata heterogama]
MDHLFDTDNDDRNHDQEGQGNGFQQQIHQLLRLVAGTLPQAIENNQIQETNVVTIPTFSGGNQDPVAWLEVVGCAFEANNIQGDRRIAVVGAYLTGMAAIRQKVEETVDQYAAKMVALFRRVTVGGNHYPEAMKAQIFVQRLRPDLALARTDPPRNMTIHNPTPFMNPVASYLQQSSNLIAQPTIPDPVGELIKKLTFLMEELVVSLKKVIPEEINNKIGIMRHSVEIVHRLRVSPVDSWDILPLN